MGLVIQADLETNQGPTKELYIRIDSWKINKTIGEITFTTTSWLNKRYADRFLRTYTDEELKPAVGLVSAKIVLYDEKENKEGLDITLNNLFKAPMTTEKVLELDILEDKQVSKEVPYTSFDDDGEEITLYRTIKQVEKVKIGTEEIVKEVFDYSPIDNLGQFCYEYLKNKLEDYFPAESIKDA